jgi:hypothetical protein
MVSTKKSVYFLFFNCMGIFSPAASEMRPFLNDLIKWDFKGCDFSPPDRFFCRINPLRRFLFLSEKMAGKKGWV